ncbi:MAG TPA: AraC family transcriptional regulator [Steroidobacteraceae bacterium]|nr:AraC family transcriptional regulator [Steroidobacteraceae bacterium]
MTTRKSKIQAENRSSKQRSAAAREGHVRAAEPLDDILVARQPLVGMLQQDIEQLLGATLTPEPGAMPPLTLEGAQRPQHWATRGMRHFLNEPEDSGYWDFFKISDGFLLSITDAQYRKDTWVRVEGTGFFKLRLLLTGSLRAASGEIIAQAPEALLYISPGVGRGGYYILAAQPIRMVVLHCRPAVLTRDFGLNSSEIPPPLNKLFARSPEPENQRLSLDTSLMHAVQLMVESRHKMMPALRGRYLEALSTEILLQVIGEFSNRAMMNRTPTGIRPRDVNGIYEARDYLTQHYRNPPKIPELARMVGLNQTKLKAGFREVTKLTIYSYITKCRMERAADLLLNGNYGIAEVAYEVGYDYPANFTSAFKKFYGKLPRSMTSRDRTRYSRSA